MNQKPTQKLTLRTSRLSSGVTALSLGIPALLASGLAHAEEEAIVLDTMQVEERTVDTNPYAEPGAPYKAKVSGDGRHVKELAETPQTITVLTQTQIQESGRSDLKEILDAQPGISLGTGENGNAFGDRYVIRGHEARSDVFVDGLRDPGMTTRESFAVEQVEITKGPSSSFAGRGSTGGAINSITKQASPEYNFNKVEGGLGTDEYRRVTLDSNVGLTDDVAVRANLLHHFEQVPDRDENTRERNGIALSGTWAASDKLDLTADYYHLSAFDQVDLGSYIDRETNKVDEDIPSYVQQQDFVKSRVDSATLTAKYKISDNVRIENAYRYGTTNNGYVVTGASGTTTDATDPNGEYSTISLSTHQGWQEVEYTVDQLNLFVDSELAGMQHQFVIGAEWSVHNVLNGVYEVENLGASNCLTAGRGGVSESYCIVDDTGNVVGDIHNLMQRDISKGDQDSDYQIDTISLYLMDTVDVTDDFSVFAGIRADMFEYSNIVAGRDDDPSTHYKYEDTLWNGHLGLVYDVADNGNVYATYSANINGGESDVGGNCGYGGLCSSAENVDKAKPESVQNIELGTKWNLMNEKLLATASIFQITKDDVMEGTDYDTEGTYNTGKNRVRGIELSATGNITEQLSTQAGLALMESEILETAATDRDGNPVEPGGRLANFADQSAFLQLRYQLTDKFAFGGIAQYSSEVHVGQPDSPASEDTYVPSYTVFDAFATYAFTKQLNARLNISNITDENYYLTAYRSGSFAYIGDARSAQLTVAYEF